MSHVVHWIYLYKKFIFVVYLKFKSNQMLYIFNFLIIIIFFTKKTHPVFIVFLETGTNSDVFPMDFCSLRMERLYTLSILTYSALLQEKKYQQIK